MSKYTQNPVSLTPHFPQDRHADNSDATSQTATVKPCEHPPALGVDHKELRRAMNSAIVLYVHSVSSQSIDTFTSQHFWIVGTVY